MPNLSTLYSQERAAFMSKSSSQSDGHNDPIESLNFEVRIDTDLRQVYRNIQKLLTAYKEERRGPSVIATQSIMNFQVKTDTILSVLIRGQLYTPYF